MRNNNSNVSLSRGRVLKNTNIPLLHMPQGKVSAMRKLYTLRERGFLN